MATRDSWSPDVEVAVHGDELIIKVDHLPDAHAFAAEVEDGEMLIHSATLDGVEDHCLRLPLPEGIDVGALETAQRGEAFEVHMWVPAAL
jgi:hypothetical protein